MTKPKVKHWTQRPQEDWNAHNFRIYLEELHAKHYGIAYVTRSYAMEAKLIKNMIDAHGQTVVRRFIDACFNDYKPSAKYPCLSFSFMYSYMRDRLLPQVLADQAKKDRLLIAENKIDSELSKQNILDWL